jgi:cell division protein FtsQ
MMVAMSARQETTVTRNPNGTGRRWRLVRARRDAVPDSLRRAHRRFRRPSRATLVYLAIGTVLLGLLGWVLYGTSLLGVREISVSGSQIAGPDAVRAAAAVPMGTPLARLDVDEVADRVRALPSVGEVDVTRSWPRTLVITVTERTPVAVVAVPDGFVVLDASGVVFDLVTARPSGVVVLRLVAPGAEDPATVAALRVVSALTPQLRAALRELSAESPTRIVLHLTDGRVIMWGDAERSDVKATVATALLDQAARTIDVSVPDVATTS